MASVPMLSTTAVRSARSSTMSSHVARQFAGGSSRTSVALLRLGEAAAAVEAEARRPRFFLCASVCTAAVAMARAAGAAGASGKRASGWTEAAAVESTAQARVMLRLARI